VRIYKSIQFLRVFLKVLFSRFYKIKVYFKMRLTTQQSFFGRREKYARKNYTRNYLRSVQYQQMLKQP